MESRQKSTTTTSVGRDPCEAALRVLSGDGVCQICGAYNSDDEPLFNVVNVYPTGAVSKSLDARNPEVVTLLCRDCHKSWSNWVDDLVADMSILIDKPALGWGDWVRTRKEQISGQMGRP